VNQDRLVLLNHIFLFGFLVKSSSWH